MSFFEWLFKDYSKYGDTHVINNLCKENAWMSIELLELKIELERLRCDFDAIRTKVKPQEVVDSGRIKKICMRPKCNQPIGVREYEIFNEDRPLFCGECWQQIYLYVDIDTHSASSIDRDIIVKKYIKKFLKCEEKE